MRQIIGSKYIYEKRKIKPTGARRSAPKELPGALVDAGIARGRENVF